MTGWTATLTQPRPETKPALRCVLTALLSLLPSLNVLPLGPGARVRGSGTGGRERQPSRAAGARGLGRLGEQPGAKFPLEVGRMVDISGKGSPAQVQGHGDGLRGPTGEAVHRHCRYTCAVHPRARQGPVGGLDLGQR